MKYIFVVPLFLVGLNCMGQDSSKNLSKNSISIIGGINETYPTVSSFSGIKPIASMEPWGALFYSYILRSNNNYSFGIKFGIGAVQYRYNGILVESDGTEIGTINLQQINEVEATSDVFVNLSISKTIGWYNEIGFLGEEVIYYLYNPNAAFNNGYQPIQNFTNENEINLYLCYYTGISIRLNKNITLIPLVTLPLFDAAILFQKNIPTDVNAYNNLRTGIMITYNFNKR